MDSIVSVIVPVYNVERYLERCVKSLVTQTYKNIEIVLVDDGATDKSGSICDELSKQDERIRVIHKENGGLSDARNVGIGVSKGEYILLVDSDDFVAKTTCEELIKVAKDTDADMVSFRELKVDEESGKLLDDDDIESKSVIVLTGHEAGRNYLYGRYIQHSAWSKLYKRELFERLLFPVGMLAEDYATTYRYVSFCKKVAWYDRKLYYYRIRKNSIMTQRSMKLTLDVYKIACKVHEFELEHFPEEIKIIETSYVNCLLKTIARIYNEQNRKYESYQMEIENLLKHLDLKDLSIKTKVVYFLYRLNKKMFAKLMMKMGLNG